MTPTRVPRAKQRTPEELLGRLRELVASPSAASWRKIARVLDGISVSWEASDGLTSLTGPALTQAFETIDAVADALAHLASWPKSISLRASPDWPNSWKHLVERIGGCSLPVETIREFWDALGTSRSHKTAADALRVLGHQVTQADVASALDSTGWGRPRRVDVRELARGVVAAGDTVSAAARARGVRRETLRVAVKRVREEISAPNAAKDS